jgi:two-component system, chemotaxis family, sensor kinase CheA
MVWPVLAHVVRNTVDHGIETPAVREARGKTTPPCVTLSLVAGDDGASLSVSDDGAGVDWDAIRSRAERLGLPHATAVDLEEALFTDKVSSREEASEVSGRGIGMGAVREAVCARGGRVELASRRGDGTTLRFVFPRTAVHDESGTLPVVSREEAA